MRSHLMQVMDMLVEQTHDVPPALKQAAEPQRFTDTRIDEQARGISVKMVPMSLLLPSSGGKSHLFNLIDTPGTNTFMQVALSDMRPADAWTNSLG